MIVTKIAADVVDLVASDHGAVCLNDDPADRRVPIRECAVLEDEVTAPDLHGFRSAVGPEVIRAFDRNMSQGYIISVIRHENRSGNRRGFVSETGDDDTPSGKAAVVDLLNRRAVSVGPCAEASHHSGPQ